jgi:hypothetical protein
MTTIRRRLTWALAIGAWMLAAAPATAQPPGGALKAVAKLYQDFAAEAVMETAELSIPDLFGGTQTTMARYLDDRLVALVMADRACSRRTQEVCNLDFSPIWDSQDMVGVTVKIAQGKTPDRVAVELKFPPNEIRTLTYVMVKTAAGWRVHDIEYAGHESLVAMLKAKPK